MHLSLSEHGFKIVEGYKFKIPECICLLKKQTFNMNRAVCVVQLDCAPKDIKAYVKHLRNRVALQVKFIPFFWGVGQQIIIICPNITNGDFPIMECVARIDNQWAIVQSIFFVDPNKKEFIACRTWGQYLTGKYQDAIGVKLESKYENVTPDV